MPGEGLLARVSRAVEKKVAEDWEISAIGLGAPLTPVQSRWPCSPAFNLRIGRQLRSRRDTGAMMAIPEPIETFMLRLGFNYSTLREGSASWAEHEQGGRRSEWVQTIVYIADGRPILATVPANAPVDPERLRQWAGVSRVRPATVEEVAHLHPESEPDAVPPLGPLFGQQVFVDETVSRRECIVFRAGSRTDAIRMRYGDFAELVHPLVGRFAVAA